MRRRGRYGQRISGLSSETEGRRGTAARTGATGASKTEGRRRIVARTAATSASGLWLQASAFLLLVRWRVAMAMVGIEPGKFMQVVPANWCPSRIGSGQPFVGKRFAASSRSFRRFRRLSAEHAHRRRKAACRAVRDLDLILPWQVEGAVHHVL